MSKSDLAERFRSTRDLTEKLARPLSPEDQTVQSMPDVSPTKWHRAHTTWFFETFVLGQHSPGYEPFDAEFRYLFNSYYEGVGPQFTRSMRGLISRPGAAEIAQYRSHVDHAVLSLLDGAGDNPLVSSLIELGIQHEQQHQELLLMDIKHVLSINPLRPAYSPQDPIDPAGTGSGDLEWLACEPEGLVEIGNQNQGFCFDNETPRHQAHLYPFEIASRLVTSGEWIDFIEDGGYERADLWLSDGWHTRKADGWQAPLYWSRQDDRWLVHTLGGTRPVLADEPVCHVSHYEADAYARWANARLATEFEWEYAVETLDCTAPRPFSLGRLQPSPSSGDSGELAQAFGECWQWTASAYLPYPGFEPAAGAIGEYNGKFMSGQMVLRGSCSHTPAGHTRNTYRNFFGPHSRWMVSGVRLARGGIK